MKNNSKARDFGISIFGPRKGEYTHAVQCLLYGELPEEWEWVKSSSNTIVARRLKRNVAYYKEFLNRSLFDGLKSLIRASRCDRARLQGEILRQKGFRSPEILCWGQHGYRHFMVTEGVNATSLGHFISKHWPPPLSREQFRAKRAFIKKLGEEIGRLHKEGICHGDLRLNNILVQQTEMGINFYFIDNERNRCFTKIPKRLIKKNLVQVNMIDPSYVTLQDRLRFLSAHSKIYPRFACQEKRVLVQKIHRRAVWRMADKAARRNYL